MDSNSIGDTMAEHMAYSDDVWRLTATRFVDLQNAIAQAHEEELRNAQLAIMPCGHHASNVVGADAGTAYCKMCELERQNRQLRYLLRCSCRWYQGAENMDGKPLQWIGVHVVRWHEHPPLPDVGFVQWDDDEIAEALKGEGDYAQGQ